MGRSNDVLGTPTNFSGFRLHMLWTDPQINDVNYKAKSIPVLNPFNKYGRIFLMSWWGFFISFWAWYAFPPLLTVTIRQDLHLSQTDVANSNAISIAATAIVRFTAGWVCDRIGPRWTYAIILIGGAIPTALAGTVTTPQGLLVIRFFVGVLGATFIPCQVWSTGFFDKNVVGTANSMAAGWGNAGGGITYFVMPAIFNSLVSRQHLTPHVAWRVAFLVPFVLIVATALFIIFLCEDAPTGKWSARARAVDHKLQTRDTFVRNYAEQKPATGTLDSRAGSEDIKLYDARHSQGQHFEAQLQEQDLLEAASWELVERPTIRGALKAMFSLQTLALVLPYMHSFGCELVIDNILGAYYDRNFPKLGQTGSGNYAAIFGLLNFVARPAGGIISDLLYRRTRTLWVKKLWIHFIGIVSGVFMLAVGLTDSHTKATMFGLMVGVGFFLEAGNGANFSLVPHVHPSNNGIMTGTTGASGTLGGLVFSLVGRALGTRYEKLFWIMGTTAIGANLAVVWIRPIPKYQLGGR